MSTPPAALVQGIRLSGESQALHNQRALAAAAAGSPARPRAQADVQARLQRINSWHKNRLGCNDMAKKAAATEEHRNT
jgi:hypothetical protein